MAERSREQTILFGSLLSLHFPSGPKGLGHSTPRQEEEATERALLFGQNPPRSYPQTPEHFSQKPFCFSPTPPQISAILPKKPPYYATHPHPKKSLSPTSTPHKSGRKKLQQCRPLLQLAPPLAPSIEVLTFIDKYKQHYSK